MRTRVRLSVCVCVRVCACMCRYACIFVHLFVATAADATGETSVGQRCGSTSGSGFPRKGGGGGRGRRVVCENAIAALICGYCTGVRACVCPTKCMVIYFGHTPRPDPDRRHRRIAKMQYTAVAVVGVVASNR